jgi:hypothetical protein
VRIASNVNSKSLKIAGLRFVCKRAAGLMNDSVVNETAEQRFPFLFLLQELFRNKKYVVLFVEAKLSKHVDPSYQYILLIDLRIMF